MNSAKASFEKLSKLCSGKNSAEINPAEIEGILDGCSDAENFMGLVRECTGDLSTFIYSMNSGIRSMDFSSLQLCSYFISAYVPKVHLNSGQRQEEAYYRRLRLDLFEEATRIAFRERNAV